MRGSGINFQKGLNPKSSLGIGLESNIELIIEYLSKSIDTLGFKNICTISQTNSDHTWIKFWEIDIRNNKDYIWILEVNGNNKEKKRYRLQKGRQKQFCDDTCVEVISRLKSYLEKIAHDLRSDYDEIYERISKLS